MNYKIKGLLLLTAFSLSACGTYDKMQKTSIGPSARLAEDVDFVRDDMAVLRPDVNILTERGEAELNKMKANAELPALKKNRPSMTFAPSETNDVRNRNNPLDNNGNLYLSYQELASEFCFPYKGKFISDYGMRGRSFHSGVDIKGIPGDTIRAAMPGVVRLSKPYSGYGNVIVVRHYNGLESVYSHNSKNLVKVNQAVEAGEAIALIGRTGRATTEHLHFEFRVAGETIDPKILLDMENCKLNPTPLYVANKNGKTIASSSPIDMSKTEIRLAEEANEEEHEETVVAVQPQANQASQPAQVAQTVQQAKPSKPAASATVSPKVHTVAKGDTLFAIARKYNTTVAEICKLNNIERNAILSLGQKIKVK